MNLTDYITNETSLISDKQLEDCRNRMQLLLVRNYSDTGFSPNSVVGKFLIERFGKLVALAEQANKCLLSDLNLENAINGSTCDCTFVANFLKGLGVDNLINANSSGVARLTFNTNTTYEMDKGELLQFNDNYIFTYYTPKNAKIKIYPYQYSSTVDADANTFFLSVGSVSNHAESSDNNFLADTYYVDIPIVGSPNATVAAGDLAGINEKLSFFDKVISVESIFDIAPFEVPTNLSDLIKLALKIQPSANFSTRQNIASYLTQKFPQVVTVSPVKSGDAEMLRDTASPLLTYRSCIDIYSKGFTTLPTCTEYIKFNIAYSEGETDPAVIFTGSDYTLNQRLQHAPLMFTNMSIGDVSSDLTAISLDANVKNAILYLGSNTSDFYDTKKPIYFKTAALDAYFGNAVIDYAGNQTHVNSEYYVWVKVSYLYDPYANIIDTFINSPACDPVASTKSKVFNPCIISKLNIKYTKVANAFFDRQSALEKIYVLINSLAYPVTYDDSYISMILLEAGAAGVLSITPTATMQLNNGSYATTTSAQPIIYTFYLCNTSLNPQVIANANTYTAINKVGPRNIAYILPKENINLEEVIVAGGADA